MSDADELIPNIFGSGINGFAYCGVAFLNEVGYAVPYRRICVAGGKNPSLAVTKLWNSLSQMGEGLVNQDLQDFWQTGQSTRDISDVIFWYFLWVCDFAKKVKCIELYQEKFS